MPQEKIVIEFSGDGDHVVIMTPAMCDRKVSRILAEVREGLEAKRYDKLIPPLRT